MIAKRSGRSLGNHRNDIFLLAVRGGVVTDGDLDLRELDLNNISTGDEIFQQSVFSHHANIKDHLTLCLHSCCYVPAAAVLEVQGLFCAAMIKVS